MSINYFDVVDLRSIANEGAPSAENFRHSYGLTGTLGPVFGKDSPEQTMIAKDLPGLKGLGFLKGVPTFLPKKFKEDHPLFAYDRNEQFGYIASRLLEEPGRAFLVVTESVQEANSLARWLRDDCLSTKYLSLDAQRYFKCSPCITPNLQCPSNKVSCNAVYETEHVSIVCVVFLICGQEIPIRVVRK